MALGLVLVRLAVGVTLAAHGAQKLFGWFGGPGLDQTAAMFEKLGFAPGRRQALAAGAAEAGGGLLIALGLATPLAAAIVFAVMLVAAISVHAPQGFFITRGGFEYTFVLGATGLSLAFMGPGEWSLDALLGWQLAGATWGVIALMVGLLGAFGPLATRQRTAGAETAH
ncbi:MAG TPA: DoxX family protein [Vicinamibacterales bacterium]|jgi:putative oxidoreductase|nr:DoxX family protein [Vicinamibacterales bacterium]